MNLLAVSVQCIGTTTDGRANQVWYNAYQGGNPGRVDQMSGWIGCVVYSDEEGKVGKLGFGSEALLTRDRKLVQRMQVRIEGNGGKGRKGLENT